MARNRCHGVKPGPERIRPERRVDPLSKSATRSDANCTLVVRARVGEHRHRRFLDAARRSDQKIVPAASNVSRSRRYDGIRSGSPKEPVKIVVGRKASFLRVYGVSAIRKLTNRSSTP